ncbi:acetylesterase [Artemisia annua]|uniref:Acetylesterase n=1 Tax=Artemisia annua TaxID=35608 RepID=A0A2U1N4R2_ARTAN|nr:acetylesterase [Artemisia annua]
MFLGPINVRANRKDVQLKVNEEYYSFRVALASGEGPYIETVIEAQLRIKLPNVMTVDAKGLQLQPDGLHLSTPAQVQVALASGEGPYIETVIEAQLRIKLPNVMTVDAKGLQLQPDGLHLSTPAQVQVGEMLAHAILQSNCSR